MDDNDSHLDSPHNLSESINSAIKRSLRALRFFQQWTHESGGILPAIIKTGLQLSALTPTYCDDSEPKPETQPQQATQACPSPRLNTTPDHSQPLHPMRTPTNSPNLTAEASIDKPAATETFSSQLQPCSNLSLSSNHHTQTSVLPPLTVTQLHPFESRESCMSIIHKCGYCAPASFGLLFAECLIQGKFTQTQNLATYRKPLWYFHRYFTLYYQLDLSRTDEIMTRLSAMNFHTIQWLLAPVFRLMLHTILTISVRSYSEDFFASDDFYDQSHWPDAFEDRLTDQFILDSIRKLHLINQDPHAAHAPHDRLLHYGHYFTQDDLLVLSRFLCIELSMHQRCIASASMQDHKASILQQSHQRHLEQRKFYQTRMPERVTISLFQELFILDEKEGITGHIDVLQRDGLLSRAASRLQLQSPHVPDMHDQIEPMAQIAHIDPSLLLEILPSMVSRHLPETLFHPSQQTRPPSSPTHDSLHANHGHCSRRFDHIDDPRPRNTTTPSQPMPNLAKPSPIRLKKTDSCQSLASPPTTCIEASPQSDTDGESDDEVTVYLAGARRPTP